MSRGKLIVVSAPSGGGKTSIVKAVMERYPSLLFSVSATTRAMRAGEVNGREYFFLTMKEFESRIRANDLVEWEEIYGDYYGTLKSEVDRALAAGRTMLFDIDVKGGLSIKRGYPDDTVLIFIKPPSFEVLKERLSNRKTEDDATLRRRLARVQMEVEKGSLFEHQVVNDELQRAIAEVENIIANHASVQTING
ncbi:MAG TPA: guanylate kinase [Bacteroidetes bacterium]|nr:guanylate kinase [Bacteroidota bacterium]